MGFLSLTLMYFMLLIVDIWSFFVCLLGFDYYEKAIKNILICVFCKHALTSFEYIFRSEVLASIDPAK